MLREPLAPHSKHLCRGARSFKAGITIYTMSLFKSFRRHTLVNGFWALWLVFSAAGESRMFLLSDPLPLSGVPLAPAIEHM